VCTICGVQVAAEEHFNVLEEPIHLMRKKEEVAHENKTRLADLPGDAFVYIPHDTPGQGKQALDRETPFWGDKVDLKVGARVLITVSNKALRNGMLGAVMDFADVVRPLNSIASGLASPRFKFNCVPPELPRLHGHH
jgi:hypothetical protein